MQAFSAIYRRLLVTLIAAFCLASPATPVFAAEPAAPPTTEEVLGFSRYLPADTSGYLSLLQGERLRQTIADSNAWKHVAEQPETQALFEEMLKDLDPAKLPPPLVTALELLKSSLASEVTLATTPDSSRQLLAVARVALLSIPIFAPSQHQPGSPEGDLLERMRAPLRTEWVSAVQGFRLPPLVLALRVRDHERYAAFVEGMLGLGLQSTLNDIGGRAPPALIKALTDAQTPVAVGRSRLFRFRLRLGDVLPPQALEQTLQRMQIDGAEQDALVAAVPNLTIELHLGFVGEYLTLCFGPNDVLVRQVVDAHEGRAKDVLASSAAFEQVRKSVNPGTLAIVYGDGGIGARELQRSILPALDTVADPQFLRLLDAPPEIFPALIRFKANLESLVESSPLRYESVISLDHGLRHLYRAEFEADQVAAATTPLEIPKIVPAGALGYSVARNMTFDPLWQQVRFAMEQAKSQNAELRRNFADDLFGEYVERQNAKYDEVLKLIDAKLVGALQGELGFVVGPFVGFSLQAPKGPPIKDIPIPSVALAIRAPRPDETADALTELFAVLAELAALRPSRLDAKAEIELTKQDLDGIEIRAVPPGILPIKGLDPHLARIGDMLVLSSSFELTKQLRDVAGGKSPNISTAPAHQALQNQLPAVAEQLGYFDGVALNRSLRSTADAVFRFIDDNQAELRFTERDQRQYEIVRRYVGVGLDFFSTFQGSVASIVTDGSTQVLREWIVIQDIQP